MANSYTSLTGAFALGRQSGQGTPASTMSYLPVLSNALQYNQTTNTLQPEIGGDYELRGSYKGGVSGGGAVNFYPRGNSIGNFLYALCGTDTVTPVSGQAGAYSHVFSPFAPAAGTDLPWYTLYKVVSQLWTEQHLDAKLDSLSIDMNKQQLVTCNGNWFALTPSNIATPALNTQVMDNAATFVSCNGTITVLDEGTGSAISSTLDTSIDRLNLNYKNQLSQDEFVVGNYYPTNSTLLQRTLQIQMDTIIRDAYLFEAIYLNGSTTTWSPTIKRVHLTMTLTSSTNIPSTTQPWTMTFDFPGLDLLMMPVSPSGAQLLRATATAQLTLGPSGSDRFTITLVSGEATY